MQFSGLQYGFGITANGSAQGVHSQFSGTIGTPVSVATYPVNPNIVYSMALQIARNATLTLNLATGVITGTNLGANQKETTTIIAASGCTWDGDLVLVITAAGLIGSLITVDVPLLIATHTTQNLIAAQCRTTLLADPRVTALFAVGGTANTVTLEKLAKKADDSTFAITVPTALGVTGSTSANTTAGAAVTMAYRLEGTVWDAKDAEGVPLQASTQLYAILMTSDSTLGTTVEMGAKGSAVTPFVEQHVNRTGNHPWKGLTVSFTPDDDVVIFVDIHAGT